MQRRTFLARTGCLAAAAAIPSLQTRLSSAPAPIRSEPLVAHRIAAVEYRTVDTSWPRLVGKNAKLDIHGQKKSAEVVLLRTDQGAMGWGLMQGQRKLAEAAKPAILGRTVAELFDPSSGLRSPQAHPFDIALHDLAGVILGQPVWKLLGADRPQEIPVYSGMIYFDDLEPKEAPAGIDQVLENCRQDIGLGYRQLKVKVGRGMRWMSKEAGLKRDIEVMRAIAQAFPHIQLLVDANDGHDAETAIAFLKGIDGIPLVWIEEPFVESLEAWRTLHHYVRSTSCYRTTLLADGEQGNKYDVLEQLEREGVLNVRLNDICGLGFTRWRELLPRLARQRVMSSPHAFGQWMKTIYTGHLGAALGHMPTIEGVTCSDRDIDSSAHRIADGRLRLGDQPGFGLRLRA